MLVMSKRKASYDLTFKLKAVKCAEEKTKEAAAREFNIDPRRFLVFICVCIRGGLLQHSPLKSTILGTIARLPSTNSNNSPAY